MVDGPEKLTAIVPRNVVFPFMDKEKKRRADIAARSVFFLFHLDLALVVMSSQECLRSRLLLLQVLSISASTPASQTLAALSRRSC